MILFVSVVGAAPFDVHKRKDDETTTATTTTNSYTPTLSSTSTSTDTSTSLPLYEPGILFLPDNAIAVHDGYELSIQGVLGGMIMIAVGLAILCRGYYDKHPEGPSTRLCIGFMTMAFITWLLLANFEPAGTYGQNRWTVYLIVPVVLGTLGAIVMPCTGQVYLFLLSAFGGLAFGLWILGWRDGLSVTSAWGRTLLLVILVLFGFALSPTSFVFPVFGAALTGSYVLFLGFDVFFHTGFTYCFTTTLDANPAHAHDYQVYKETYIMQAALIVSFLVGIVIQLVTLASRATIQAQHDLLFQFKNMPIMRYFRPMGPGPAPPPPVVAQ